MAQQETETVYAASATAYGDGRAGHVTSDTDVLDLDLDLDVPKEMGGPGGDLTNPEQMFAAGYAAWGPGLKRLIIGVGMVPRGEVGLIFAQIGLASGLLTSGLFSAVTVMVILTTIVTLPMLRMLLDKKTPDVHPAYSDYVMDAPDDD